MSRCRLSSAAGGNFPRRKAYSISRPIWLGRSGQDGKKGEQDADDHGGGVGDDGISVAMADDSNDAHRQAVSRRDSYWNCLAQQYSRDSNRGMSGTDFATLIAGACPSERQNFRVMLLGFLSMQFPEVDAGAHMTTANNAIASAQRDVVKAFVRHKAATK
jgi:hypothetical protein